MENVTNLIRIKSNSKLKMSPEGDFFRAWAEFTRPIHKLSKKEMDVFAEILKERYELSKVIIDNDVLDSVLMDKRTKLRIRTRCGLKPKHFQVIMSKFRKNGVIVNNRINLTLIPLITEEGAGLMVYFSFKDEQLVKLSSQESVKKPVC